MELQLVNQGLFYDIRWDIGIRVGAGLLKKIKTGPKLLLF